MLAREWIECFCLKKQKKFSSTESYIRKNKFDFKLRVFFKAMYGVGEEGGNSVNILPAPPPPPPLPPSLVLEWINLSQTISNIKQGLEIR